MRLPAHPPLFNVLACAGILLWGPHHLHAQMLRTVSAVGSLSEVDTTDVSVAFSGGSLEMRPSRSATRYSMLLEYDAALMTPIHNKDDADQSIALGARSTNAALKDEDELGGTSRIELPDEAPLRLSLNFARGHATMALGGVHLSGVDLRVMASESWVRFDLPNRGVAESFAVKCDASLLRMTNLANSRASNIEMDANLARVVLDFGGVWTEDLSTSLDLVLATAELRVPRSVGIEITTSGILAGFEPPAGFTRVGDGFRSANWSDAAFKLRVAASMVVGKVRIVRLTG